MKIKTITYIERKNLGNYEYAELSSVAELSEGEDEVVAVEKLIAYVQASLKGEIDNGRKNELCPDNSNVDGGESKEVETKEESTVNKKTKKSTKKSKEIETPAVETPKKEKLVVYDSTIAEHKSIFGGYLAKKYDTSWKTSHPADEIKSFTASLNGKDFLDNDGKIVESFLNLVHGFFGA
jgi:hypothetical protein